MSEFLPINRKEMEKRGWPEVDFVYVCGDAYVDHPSFGHAIITRLLERHGYRVGILAQPDWKKEEAIREFGRPRLAFLVSAGNMDSMVNHYSVSRKHRQTDAYSPGGEMGKRPDRAVVVYGNWIRRNFPDVPIILGGIEASLRRLAHYDYWSDSLRKSVLLDAQADLISYGMGERSILEIAEALDSGLSAADLTYIPGTVYRCSSLNGNPEAICLPSYEELTMDKRSYASSFATQYRNTDPFSGKALIEPYGKKLFVVQNPPAKPLSRQELDDIYELPYCRTWHPSYDGAGGVPAIQEVKFSLTSSRGCFGGCSFCALTFHQGRIVQARSQESLLAEAKRMTEDPEFKGYIHDVGGPTANFRHPSCKKQERVGVCPDRQCLFPEPCPNLTVDHREYISLLRKLRALPGVKKVFIRSGIRFDYLMADPDDTFLWELCRYHVSGQLKVAPEHVSPRVLRLMGKPKHSVYQAFAEKFQKVNQSLGKKQYLVPYLISSHPGSTRKDGIALAECVRDMGYMPEQVQDFYPTPSTISTCMYYTGLDPRTMEAVTVIRDPHEKAMQRALIQYRDPKLHALVEEALQKEGRTDLIGFGKNCLIRPSGQKMDGQRPERMSEKGHPKKKKVIRNIHKKKG
ncbi:YgiQ family radical SAM protein [Hominifimenecus sp. rT4P-3]|uniref:YgiQ family radical SAM protein n=1 Tax=Hominifimenecus sp. rT4P-3 TaxID=3242979 RepID=UPI003DA43953